MRFLWISSWILTLQIIIMFQNMSLGPITAVWVCQVDSAPQWRLPASSLSLPLASQVTSVCTRWQNNSGPIQVNIYILEILQNIFKCSNIWNPTDAVNMVQKLFLSKQKKASLIKTSLIHVFPSILTFPGTDPIMSLLPIPLTVFSGKRNGSRLK